MYVRPHDTWRISGIAGLLFVVASFVASAINVELPRYNQDPTAIAAWFAENGQQYRVGLSADRLAVAPAPTAALRQAARRREA